MKFLLKLYHLFNQLVCPHRDNIRRVVLIEETAVTPAEIHVYLECMHCLKRTRGVYFNPTSCLVAGVPWRTEEAA